MKRYVLASILASIVLVEPVNLIVAVALGAMNVSSLGQFLIAVPVASGLGLAAGHEVTMAILRWEDRASNARS
jgi:hypothetical protein